MVNLIISLHQNTLKASLLDAEGFRDVSITVSDDIVSGSMITDVQGFAQSLDNLIDEFEGIKRNKLELTFLVEPDDVILRFVTIGKDVEDIDTAVLDRVKEKVEDINLEEYYFSYQKIAPFVYQFVAVKREFLENYIEVANTTELSLKAVIPWVLMMPKILKSNDPCILIAKEEEKQVVALSELNGIYYANTFDQDKSPKEVQDLVKKLSIYKRAQPINKIYVLNGSNFNISGNYNVAPLLELSEEEKEDTAGYETHVLVLEVLDRNSDYLRTQANLLNLLPVPAVEEKSNKMVYVGAFAAAFMIALAGFGGYMLLSNNSSDSGGNDQMAQNNEGTAVLSEEEANESTESENTEETDEQLNREDISIQIENGAGIAGIAGRTEEFFEEQGYVVFDIGNAETTDYEETELVFKEEALKYKDLLIEDMSENFTVVVSEETLGEDVEYDVLMIVGSTTNL